MCLRKFRWSQPFGACTEPPLFIALAGNKNWNWWRNFIGFRKIALVESETYAAARVDVKQRLADRDVHERFHVGKLVRLIGDLNGYIVAQRVAKLLKVVSQNIRNKAAIRIVEANYFTFHSLRIHCRKAGLQPN